MSFLPKSLTQLPIWLLWRLEADAKGRPTKIPYSAKQTDRKASSTDPQTWTTHAQARTTLEEHAGEFNGLGAVMCEQHGFVFIDVDDCVDASGQFDQRAQDALAALPQSYAELSQSGHGLHIIARGRIRAGFNNRKIHVEMYSSGRFVAVTGNAVRAQEPAEEQAGIDYLYQKYRTEKRKKDGPGPAPGKSRHSVDWILEHAARHGDKFPLLLSGEWQAAGYESQSEADLAFCTILAYWSDRDPAMIDEIFRSSCLYRDKWERDDYRSDTIAKACGAIGRSFSEWTAEHPLAAEVPPEMYEARKATGRFFPEGRVTQALVEKALGVLDPAKNELYHREDDIAVARLFADVFHEVARFNASTRAWSIYDGRRWNRDTEGLGAERFAKILARALLRYASKTEDTNYTKFVAKLQDRRRRETMIRDARDFYPVEASDFDRDPYLLNVQNGVLDLRNGQLLDHDPDMLLSKIANVRYDPSARSDAFEKFLGEVLQNDAGVIDYVKRVFGSSLIGENLVEQFFIFYGSTTRNGKSTLCDTIVHLFGDYAANISPETLALTRERNSRAPSSDLARLEGVRLVQCSEPPRRMNLDAALVKALTGRDIITARRLHENEIQFTPAFALVMNTNYLPLVTDDTLFTSDRIRVIEFRRHFKPNEQDVHLKGRLKTAQNLSGTLNWLLEGLREYQADNDVLPEPSAVEHSTEAYRKKSDKLQEFLDDCTEAGGGDPIQAKVLYFAYSSWCKSTGFGVDNKSNFFDDLRKKGMLQTRGTIRGVSVRNVVPGIKIKDQYLTGQMQ